tara:strand:+ start:46 stop:165 length:120 start_codon:yes stop_codon:yes gene_type:complete
VVVEVEVFQLHQITLQVEVVLAVLLLYLVFQFLEIQDIQ